MNQLKSNAQLAIADIWDDQGITNYQFSLNTGEPANVNFVVEI